MTLSEAEALARKIHAATDALFGDSEHYTALVAADRERIASDLAGLRQHETCTRLCEDRPRYAAGLLRTASLYGIEP